MQREEYHESYSGCRLIREGIVDMKIYIKWNKLDWTLIGVTKVI